MLAVLAMLAMLVFWLRFWRRFSIPVHLHWVRRWRLSQVRFSRAANKKKRRNAVQRFREARTCTCHFLVPVEAMARANYGRDYNVLQHLFENGVKVRISRCFC